MPTLIKTVRDRNIIEFDNGRFDNWCVFLTRPGQARYAPMDKEYFLRLRTLGNVHGHQKIYNDFVLVYTPTNGKERSHAMSAPISLPLAKRKLTAL